MAVLLKDTGHGVNTWPPSKGTAASGGVPGMAEHTFNAAVSDEVERLLKGKLRLFGAQASNRPDVHLTTRVRQYNAETRKDPTAIGVSTHGNASADKLVRGFGVFYFEGSVNGKRLAEMILAEYKREFPDLPIWGSGLHVSRRGTWSDFAILRDTSAPFVLVEFEFFTNNVARRLMLTNDYRKRCGLVVARTAAKWYGIKLGTPQPAATTPAAAPASDPFSKGWLQIRDRGASVGTMQGNLNQFATILKRKPLVVDNIFGQLSEDYLKAWQRHYKLKVDGYFGKQSAAFMDKKLQELAQAAERARAAAAKKAEEAAQKKPGAAKFRVLVDGKQTGAYAIGNNALKEAERAIGAGAKNIVIKEI